MIEGGTLLSTLRWTGCVTVGLPPVTYLVPLLFLCALSFLPCSIACLGHRPSADFLCTLFFSFAFLRRESLVLPFVCALVEGQLSLSHMHALSLARLCLLSSHTLSLLSFYRSCVLSLKHSHRSLVRFASRERLSSSLSQWFREQVFEHPVQSHPLPRSSCPLTARNRRRLLLPALLHRTAAQLPPPLMWLRC